MGTDLTFLGGAWPGYDIPCLGCGAGCRPIDRFCSQCGRRDPTGQEAATADPSLTSPTVIGGDDAASAHPDLAPTFLASGDLPLDAAEADTSAPVDPTIVLQGGTPLPTPSKATRASRAVRRQRQTEIALALEKLLVPGNVFGRRYRIQRFLGAGAMGHVCSAIDDSIDEVVALKILSAPVQEDPESFERFKLELKLARRIRHRNVVQSFDLGFADGYPYISMEYIDADNLKKHLQRKPVMDEPVALAILRQVLRGLRAAHELGIIHRDIKPENILLNKDGVAFITDFGIATTADRVRRREIAGTPDYMAPEQLRCEDVAPASDLYACGVLLYRMVSGTLPFRATTMHGMIEAHLHQAPEPLPGEAEVSRETQELIDWMLRKPMQERPQHANDVLERIDAILSRGASARSNSQRLTVLVAEEDPQTLAFLRGVLETDGYRVIGTSNARDAVNVAFEQTPSVILLDATIRGGFEMVLPDADTDAGGRPLPGADGLGFLRILREDDKLRRVPVVVMAGEPQNAFRDSGVADFLMKPLAPADVMNAVRRAFSERALR